SDHGGRGDASGGLVEKFPSGQLVRWRVGAHRKRPRFDDVHWTINPPLTLPGGELTRRGRTLPSWEGSVVGRFMERVWRYCLSSTSSTKFTTNHMDVWVMF